MIEQAEAVSVPEVSEGSLVCRHHWLIQAADGPASAGICRICGETRQFQNYVETAAWGDTRLVPGPAPVISPDVILASADGWDDE